MASVNKIFILGNLGKDPEIRYSADGTAFASFTVATTDKWKSKNGEMNEHTEWHRVSFAGRLAEIAGEYLKKGSPVFVEGQIRTRKWTDKDGNEKYSTEVKGLSLQLLGSRTEGGSKTSVSSTGSKAAPSAARPPKGDDKFADMTDDIPF